MDRIYQPCCRFTWKEKGIILCFFIFSNSIHSACVLCSACVGVRAHEKSNVYFSHSIFSACYLVHVILVKEENVTCDYFWNLFGHNILSFFVHITHPEDNLWWSKRHVLLIQGNSWLGVLSDRVQRFSEGASWKMQHQLPSRILVKAGGAVDLSHFTSHMRVCEAVEASATLVTHQSFQMLELFNLRRYKLFQTSSS